MPRYSKHEFQIGEWWLSQRDGSPAWYATFYDAAAKRSRRVSLGTDDFEQARQRLLERYLDEHRPQQAPAETVALADIVLDYYKKHGSEARSAVNIRKSCAYWVDFFGDASIAEADEAAPAGRLYRPPDRAGARHGLRPAHSRRRQGRAPPRLAARRNRERAVYSERQGGVRRASRQAAQSSPSSRPC